MIKNHNALQLAVSSLFALSLVAVVQSAYADAVATEQCAGIVKASANDCATSTNECHGHVTSDNNPEAWVYLPKGRNCARIVGAHLVKVKDPTPAKVVNCHARVTSARPTFKSAELEDPKGDL